MNQINILHTICTSCVVSFIVFNSPVAQASSKYGNEMVDTIDSVYRDLQYVFNAYPVPGLSLKLDGEISPCGVVDSSFYCKKDKTIYVPVSDIKWAYENFGRAALMYIIAHEYGHSLMESLQIEFKNTTNSEVAADCWAGVGLGILQKSSSFNIRFSLKDREVASLFAITISDNQVYSRNHHGTPEIRVHAFNAGFDRANKKQNPYWNLLCGGIN